MGTASTVGDTATFVGTTSVAPTGSVAFTLYSDSACTASTGVSGTGTIHPSGGAAIASFSAAWSAPAAGTYYWQASYAGDANNNSSTTACGSTGELLAVGPASPTLTT